MFYNKINGRNYSLNCHVWEKVYLLIYGSKSYWLIKLYYFLDPFPMKGPLKWLLSFCLFVCLSFCPSVWSFSQEWIFFPIYCTVIIGIFKNRLSPKICVYPNLGKKGSKWPPNNAFGIFWKNLLLVFPENN